MAGSLLDVTARVLAPGIAFGLGTGAGLVFLDRRQIVCTVGIADQVGGLGLGVHSSDCGDSSLEGTVPIELIEQHRQSPNLVRLGVDVDLS